MRFVDSREGVFAPWVQHVPRACYHYQGLVAMSSLRVVPLGGAIDYSTLHGLVILAHRSLELPHPLLRIPAACRHRVHPVIHHLSLR